MARKANQKQLQKAAELLNRKPGYKSGEYARMLGCHRETFNRILVQLNDRSVLLFEDQSGRIWPLGDG